MDKKHSRPNWWILYLTVPLLILLGMWEVKATLTPREHTVLELMIILVIFGLAWLWLDKNGKWLI